MAIDFNPDEGSLGELLQKLKTLHSEKRSQQTRWQQMYEQQTGWVRAAVPADIPIYASSLATDLVDEIANQVRTDEPVINFTAFSNTAKAREHRTLMEKWMNQELAKDRDQTEMPPMEQVAADLPLRGEAVVRQLHNAARPIEPIRTEFDSEGEYLEAKAMWEREMQDWEPLLPIQALDPMVIYLPPHAAFPFPYILEHQTRRQIDMWDKWPAWQQEVAGVKFNKDDLPPLPQTIMRLNPFTGDKRSLTEDEMVDPTREVQWLEFWSHSHHIVEVDGVRIMNDPNPYGIVPYAHVYSGLGRKDAESGPESLAIGILGKLDGEVEAEIIMKTIGFAMARNYVFPRLRVPKGEEDYYAARLQERSILGYDESNPLGPDQIQWLDTPPINDAVTSFLNQNREAIERRVSPALRGSSGGESGIQDALATGNSLKGILPIFNATNKMGTQIAYLKTAIAKALNEKINVRGGRSTTQEKDSKNAVADPDKGHFDFQNWEIEFAAFDELEDMRKQQHGLNLRERGGITKRTLRTRHLNRVVEDAEDEAAQELLEKAEEVFTMSPEFQAYAVDIFVGEQQVAADEEQRAARDQAGIPQADSPEAQSAQDLVTRLSGGQVGTNASASSQVNVAEILRNTNAAGI